MNENVKDALILPEHTLKAVFVEVKKHGDGFKIELKKQNVYTVETSGCLETVLRIRDKELGVIDPNDYDNFLGFYSFNAYKEMINDLRRFIVKKQDYIHSISQTVHGYRKGYDLTDRVFETVLIN